MVKINRYPDSAKNLLSDFLETNKKSWVTDFESEFLKIIPGKYAIAVNSATSGLHAALYALGVSPGDEVISPGLTVVMDTYVTLHLGAIPVFADICPKTHNICADAIEKLITKKTKAIIIVDWQGLPCNYDSIVAISKKYKIPVICDSAQTILAQYKGKPCGDQFEIFVYSFEQKKHLTTGSEGGMVVCQDPDIAEKIRKFSGIGYKHLTANAGRTSLSKSTAQNPNYKRFDTIGFNYRMNEVSAVLGLAQLERIYDLVEHRIKVANIFINILKKYKCFKVQEPFYDSKHTFYTVGAVYSGHVEWKKIYDEYSATGAEPFYAAVSNPYLEPTLVGIKMGFQIFTEGLCPNAEKIQKGLMAFKTNYIDLDSAQKDALSLESVLNNLNLK
jgi:perosamine synthetase